MTTSGVSLPVKSTASAGRGGTRRERRWPLYLWIVPALAIYAVFKIGPLIAGVYLSLLRWDGIKTPVFVGLQNFQRILNDDQMIAAFGNNIKYGLGTVVGKMALALLLAVLLNQALRGRVIYRTILFLPVVMSFVVIGILWTWLYNADSGLINALLRLIHLDGLAHDWLGDSTLALISLMVVDIWKWYGFHMVIFLAGLQTIPPELYEAARVDGASRWRQFWSITLPLLRPAMLINVTLATLGALNVFDIPYIMTGGGPANATMVMSLYSYNQGFAESKLGYGTALSYVLLVVVIVIAFIQLRATFGDSLNNEVEA